jgi:hypothetical protein
MAVNACAALWFARKFGGLRAALALNRRGWPNLAASECPSISAAARYHRDKERLVARQPLHRHLPLRLVLEIDVGKRLTGRVLHDEGFLAFLDRPWRRKRRRSVIAGALIQPRTYSTLVFDERLL